ncbi:hypothetical protein [Frankia sp. CiP1_Cm_nod2]|uniref:hypothetical protein n=1 Tax=Frankia sp. CiP1_Cm_nod2 TaxID=2897161 RepID=UPI002024D0F9
MSRVTEQAEQWARGITSDTDVAISLYTDDVRYDGDWTAGSEHGPAAGAAGLRERLAAYPERDTDSGPEGARFEVLEAVTTTRGNESPSVTVLWRQDGGHRAGYQGSGYQGSGSGYQDPSTGGENPPARDQACRDQAWRLTGTDGRIDGEPTTWNDAPVFQRIGSPAPTTYSWEKDADPASSA